MKMVVTGGRVEEHMINNNEYGELLAQRPLEPVVVYFEDVFFCFFVWFCFSKIKLQEKCIFQHMM